MDYAPFFAPMGRRQPTDPAYARELMRAPPEKKGERKREQDRRMQVGPRPRA
jgi:hypothetical protein